MKIENQSWTKKMGWITKALILINIIFSLNIFSQENNHNKREIEMPINFLEKGTNVDDHVFGIQVGYLGFWINHELKLSKKFSLRTEIGSEYRRKFSIDPNWKELNQTASLIFEPKYYINLDKRYRKNKKIEDNAGNYVSIKTTLPFYKNPKNETNISYFLTPSFGIRRNIGKLFNLEWNVGYGFNFSDQRLYIEALTNFRLGLRF